MLKHNLYWKQVKNGKKFCWFFFCMLTNDNYCQTHTSNFLPSVNIQKNMDRNIFVQGIAWGSVRLLQDCCILWDFLETVFSTKVIQSFKNFMSMFSFDPFCVNDPIFFNAFQCFLYFAANATEYRKKLIRCIKTFTLFPGEITLQKLYRNSTNFPHRKLQYFMQWYMREVSEDGICKLVPVL